MATTLYYAHDPLLSSPAMTTTAAVMNMSSDDCWTMPTPPVSPKVEPGVDEDDLDLGLGDILGLTDCYLPGLSAFDQDWLFGEVQNEVQPEVTAATSCAVGETTPSPLRHDCMWAGHCPAEEQHRLTSGLHPQLPSFLLSSSPTDPSHILMSTSCRTRLDTLGSIRPETPLSLSDSEMDAEPLTSSQESGSSSSGSSSSADESETDEMAMPKFLLPTNINPVRSHRSKPLKTQTHNNNNMGSQLLMAADHSYSHSDHSYHTQRRPASDHHGALTPSDSEEEIDVVSLGEVLRMNPKSSAMTSSASSSSSTTSTANAPIRLKLKVSSASFSQPAVQQQQAQQPAVVMQRKALPAHPSAIVRQQLQMAVAASAATRQVKTETTKKPETQMKQQKRPRSAMQDSDSASGSRSPRKSSARGSRAGSDSEDSCEKRSQHNSMERQRRVDLRNAFEFLRSLIPDLEAADRAAKVVILKKASLFCQSLTAKERQHVAEKDALQKRQEMLRKRIALLQRRR